MILLGAAGCMGTACAKRDGRAGGKQFFVMGGGQEKRLGFGSSCFWQGRGVRGEKVLLQKA